MEAERYLRELVRKRTQQLEASPQEEASRMASSFLREANAVLEALLATGNTDHEAAMREFVSGFADDLERRGFLERSTTQSSMSMSLGGFTGRAVGSRPVPERRASRPEPKIITVMPLVKGMGSIGEYGVSTISLELWSESMVLRYALTRSEPERLESRRGRWVQPIGWEAQDDVGTTYTRMGHSGHGGGTLLINEDSFQPAPPSDARALTLIAHDTIEDTDENAPRIPHREKLGAEIARIAVPLAPR